ncbi:phosphatase PAP2 family protein [Reinekea thalattae]|uniref:undecaprenyl-diphosphate phosphatase n=1 Tax=Reinekea thalattae TaxID=2593301 RepID=A0A5C8Z8T4_9GAMM|nr:phosphatase PAP2 family protein [Reinekea thalattae]TXR53764.1 phosphatase PAP2 family protein [Reinekea thalattae]
MKLFQPVHNLDLAMFQWCMARRRRHLLTNIGRAISKTADGWVYALFVFAYAAIDWPHGAHYLKYFLSAFVIERLIYFVLKNGFKRHRPADAIDDFSSFIVPSDKFSFPSGHTSAAFLFVVFVGYLFPALMPLLLCWAVLVAMSRIFLGVHFPTDTVVGAVLGSSVGIVVLNYGAFL